MTPSSRQFAKEQRLKQLCEFDRNESEEVQGWTAGVDEAGRGPLAGPVVAAAVILFQPDTLLGINDSKKLSPSARHKLFFEISRSGLVGIGLASETEIDQLNIYQAARLAMKRAVLNLTHTPAFLLIDGPMKLDLPIGQKGIVRGDQKSASIAAASVIAKVYRDLFMIRLHTVYPHYAFATHKGYPTPEHLEKLFQLGPCPAHRRSFGPVRASEAKSANEAVMIKN